MCVAATGTHRTLTSRPGRRLPQVAPPRVFQASQGPAEPPEQVRSQQVRSEQVRSDQVEGELVENMLLGGLGVLANQVNLAVRTTTMVKAHDVSVGG
jgi:hypothetical protein